MGVSQLDGGQQGAPPGPPPPGGPGCAFTSILIQSKEINTRKIYKLIFLVKSLLLYKVNFFCRNFIVRKSSNNKNLTI